MTEPENSLLDEILFYLDDDDTYVAFLIGAVHRGMPAGSDDAIREELLEILRLLVSAGWVAMATWTEGSLLGRGGRSVLAGGHWALWDPAETVERIRREWLALGRPTIADIGYVLLRPRGSIAFSLLQAERDAATAAPGEVNSRDPRTPSELVRAEIERLQPAIAKIETRT